MIDEACRTNHEGTSAFEAILKLPDIISPGFHIGLRELVVTACWYAWWELRQVTHGEPIQKPARSAQAIAAMATNYYRSLKPNHGVRRYGWEKVENPNRGF